MASAPASVTGSQKKPIFRGDVAEAALAHMVSNKTEAAYRRGKLLDKRSKLMDAWGSYCEGLRASVIRMVA